MLYTYKSITKNFQKCCLKEAEELTEIFQCKSTNLKKKFLLGFTNQNRFLMALARPFGKMPLLNEFVPEDVKSIEMGAKTGLGLNYFLKINYKGKQDIFKVLLKIEKGFLGPTKYAHSGQTKYALSPGLSNILKTIYEQVPESKPSYLKDSMYLGSLAAKTDLHFLFTDNKLLVLGFDETNISVKREIDYSKITDFDIYSTKTTYQKFYLEIDSKPELYKTDISELNYLISILRLTNIPKSVPSYMDDDENIITSLNVADNPVTTGFGDKIMRFTTKNVYLINKLKDGKLIPEKKIPISDISSIKSDPLGAQIASDLLTKNKAIEKHIISIKTKDGKKISLWYTNLQNTNPNEAIDYIKQNIS